MSQRIRLTFTKQDALRYIGHLDLHKVIERTARRAGLQLAYSQGYHPKPKIHLASALPLGFASRAEVMDIWLHEDDLDLDALPACLTRYAPPGLQVISARQVAPKTPALQQALQAAEYEITLHLAAESAPSLQAKLEALLAEPSLPRERRGKPYDLRPLILQAEWLPSNQEGQPRFRLLLSARPGATGRPDEVLQALDIPRETAFIERTALFFS